MAGETVITIVGNLTADPELRYTQNGLAVANFTIASTPRTLDSKTNEWKDGEPLFLRASMWREFADTSIAWSYAAIDLVRRTAISAKRRCTKPQNDCKSDAKSRDYREEHPPEGQEVNLIRVVFHR